MVFSDRKEAGRILGEYIRDKLERVDLVMGIPRGGVVVAREVARVLGVPLSLLIVRKLGVPSNPELAFGAIDPEGCIYTDSWTVEYFKLSKEVIEEVAREELEKIREREKRFLKDRPLDVKGKIVLVVDDGIATGQTVKAGVEYLKRMGASKVIVAVPVCPGETAKRLGPYADGFYCYHVSEASSFAVGMFYRDFRQVEDEEVEELLRDGIL
ncbi:MAG: phosphoribosyltransferase family protein [Aquificaceae bacterium]|nr:phosphoribosyltransferase family protein [Aquificaceae bacterium]MCX7989048.1 phosphoribosyltransferase family protein [Aquificaceae bacterium]MDW8032191.1 phosphoribosyltransferase family protein [Aquificaceae bacterium]